MEKTAHAGQILKTSFMNEGLLQCGDVMQSLLFYTHFKQ